MKHELARRLRLYLDSTGLSRRNLSRITGVPDSTICRVLKGERNLSQKNLIKISQATGCDLDWFLGLGSDDEFITNLEKEKKMNGLFQKNENMKEFNAILLKRKLDNACQKENSSLSAFWDAHKLSSNVRSLYYYLYQGRMPEDFLDELIKVLSLTNNPEIYTHRQLPKGGAAISNKERAEKLKELSIKYEKEPIDDLVHHMIELIQSGCLREISFSAIGIKFTLEKE